MTTEALAVTRFSLCTSLPSVASVVEVFVSSVVEVLC